MADTVAAAGLTVQQWDDKFYTEYVRENRFKKYMGTDESAMIQLKDKLTTKKGKFDTFALVNRLTGGGVTGKQTLMGNEEDLLSRSYKITVDKLRHGVRVPEIEEQYSAIDLRDAGRSVLKVWIMEKTRNDIITALGSINGVAYGSASETQKDAWLVDNADRVLFGSAKSNNAANDHSACLANIDNTSDKVSPESLSLLKRIALNCNPKIRPLRTKDDQEWFVVFMNSLCFRDFSNDATVTQANRDARTRGLDNPLFTGGELIWDGMIIREIPEISVISGVGAGSIDVAPVYLCGAQALGIAWAKRTTSKTEEFDYGDKFGVAIEEIRGIEKLRFGSGAADTDDYKDNGVCTGYFASVADA